MRASSLIQSPDADLYSIECLEEIDLHPAKVRARFSVRCRFQTVGQRLFVGMLNPACPWHESGRRGVGVSIDTEDGTVVDLLNDLGVVDYVDAAPLKPADEVVLGVKVEKQNRVLIAEITVNGESILHPAIYLEETERLGGFVGTTLLWGGSATFEGSEVSVDVPAESGGTALAS